jgi:hypothetical protein
MRARKKVKLVLGNISARNSDRVSDETPVEEEEVVGEPEEQKIS